MKFFAILACVLTINNAAWAEEAKMTPVQDKQSAPYAGVLLSPEAVAQIVSDYLVKEEEKNIAVTRAIGETKAQCSYRENEIRIALEADKKVAQAQIESAKAQNELLNRELKKAEERQSNPLLWGSLGVAVGVAITVLSAAVISNK